jgi:hypothetical protein
MPIFRSTWKLVQNGDDEGTWSEVWYHNVTDFPTLLAFQAGLVDDRRALAHPTTEIQSIRYNLLFSPRQTYERTINLAGTWPAGRDVFNRWQPVAYPSAVANVINVLTSNPPGRRFWWCRGISEDANFRNPNNSGESTALFDSRLLTFMNDMKLAGGIILVRIDPSVPGFQQRQITEIDGRVEGQTDLYTPDVTGIVPGNVVTVHRVNQKDYPALRGGFQVMSVGAGFIRVRYQVPDDSDNMGLLGYFRLLAYRDNAPIDPVNSVFAFVGTHQTRLPFIPSRGARRSDRRLRLSP